jgi:quinol monooxygenase YgiN
MEITTSRFDEFQALSERMREERGDALLATKATVTADRDNPHHYVIVIEFDSYDEAMKNSNDPATTRFAEEMGALLDAPPVFRNLDVVNVM